MKTVVLLGTGHRVQVGKAGDIAAFEARLHSACNEFAIRAIGEEMNPELLETLGTTDTVASRVASRLSVPHRYCDPSLSTRRQLGTTTVNQIDAEALQFRWSDEEKAKRLATHFDVVEAYWLEQMAILDGWPMLFVCGANHVPTFSRRVSQRGHSVVVAEADWGA